MASVIFLLGVRALLRGNLDMDSDGFRGMLTTGSYVPDTDTHDFRNDVTNELPNGSGYATGGKAIDVAVGAADAANNRVAVEFGPISWTNLTATGIRWLVVYKNRGGLPSADEIVFAKDLESDINISNGTLTINLIEMRFQLPA